MAPNPKPHSSCRHSVALPNFHASPRQPMARIVLVDPSSPSSTRHHLSHSTLQPLKYAIDVAIPAQSATSTRPPQAALRATASETTLKFSVPPNYSPNPTRDELYQTHAVVIPFYEPMQSSLILSRPLQSTILTSDYIHTTPTPTTTTTTTTATTTPLDQVEHFTPLTHRPNSKANSLIDSPQEDMAVPFFRQHHINSSLDSDRSTFELSNILLPSQAIYSEPISLASSCISTIPSSPAHSSPLSARSPPKLRPIPVTQPSPTCNRSATAPAEHQFKAPKVFKARSTTTIIGRVPSNAEPTDLDCQKSITAIREGDRREQEKAIRAILRPPLAMMQPPPRSWQAGQDHHHPDALNQVSHSTDVPQYDYYAAAVGDIPTPSPPHLASPSLSSHLPPSPVHHQEHGPLATEQSLLTASQVISSASRGIALPISELRPHRSETGQSTIHTTPLSSPAATTSHKFRRSLHIGKLSKLLTKLRQDDLGLSPRQGPSQLLTIPPVPSPILSNPWARSASSITPSTLPPSSASSPTRDLSAITNPQAISQAHSSPAQALPVVKKKQSLSQRIARRLSLSSRLTEPVEQPFDTTEALPLPRLDCSALSPQPTTCASPDSWNQPHQVTTLSSPLLTAPTKLVGVSTDDTAISHSFKTDCGSDTSLSHPRSTFVHSLHHPPLLSSSSCLSCAANPSDYIFELRPAHKVQSPPFLLSSSALLNDRNPASVDSHQASQSDLNFLTSSTSDKDLSNIPERFPLRFCLPPSPSSGLSYSTDYPEAYSTKGYFPTYLPSPAPSDFQSPSSPIDPSFLPASSSSFPTQQTLVSLDRVCQSNLHPSLVNPKALSTSDSPITALSADLPVHSISTRFSRGFVSVTEVPTNLYSSNVSTDSLGILCAPSSARSESPRQNLPPSIWCASSQQSDMSRSLLTRTSLGGRSLDAKVEPPLSSLSTQLGGGSSRSGGNYSTSKAEPQSNQSASFNTGLLDRGPNKREESKHRRGSGSESDDSSRDAPSGSAAAMVEDTDEDESDDSDDVPLGQRHPDALKVQKSLQRDRAKRHARRKAREEAKAEMESRALALAHRQTKAAEEEHRQAVVAQQAQVQRELDLAATAAKLSMKTRDDLNDEDDNKPLGLLKRQKSTSQTKPMLRDPFAVPPDDLSRRLERVQQQSRTKPGQQPQRPTGLSIKTETKVSEPIGHPLLPQTDASVQSRKASCGQVEPLSPFVQESVLTWGNSVEKAPNDVDAELALLLNSQLSNHKSPPNTNMVEPKPAAPHAHAHSRGDGLKRGQTTDVNRPKPDSSLPPMASVLDQRSRSEGLRRSNTTTARQRVASPNNSPYIPHSFLPPVPAPSSTLLSRVKSTSRRPSALAIPTQSLPSSSDHGALSPTISPTMPCSMSRTLSRRALQKVSLVDRNHTMMIEIDEKTVVCDLLKEAEQRGGEMNWATSKGYGEWGLFEVWHDLGIERPVREIETIFSVVDTWTENSDNSYLLIQKHSLASLAIQNRSITAGSFGTNLFCELKPGKWSKKFVLLKENSIYICANEKGKDEIFLCTLNNFDVFYVTSSIIKSPKPFGFGIKSLNQFSFFETKSDFVHYFACKDESTQLEWIRRIYDARTFYIMSNATAIHESQHNRSKTSDPPSTTTTTTTTTNALRTSAEHARPKASNNIHRSNPNGVAAQAATPISESTSRQTKTNNDLTATTTTIPRNLLNSNGLTRRPTLLDLERSSKFRQGTLLGDLNSVQPSTTALPPPLPPPPSLSTVTATATTNHTNTNTNTATTTTHNHRPIQATLPSHVTSINSSSSANHHHHANNNKISKSWEQMGPLERKEHLAEVQARVKLDGKTLLKFEEKELFGGALLKNKKMVSNNLPTAATTTTTTSTGSVATVVNGSSSTNNYNANCNNNNNSSSSSNGSSPVVVVDSKKLALVTGATTTSSTTNTTPLTTINSNSGSKNGAGSSQTLLRSTTLGGGGARSRIT